MEFLDDEPMTQAELTRSLGRPDKCRSVRRALKQLEEQGRAAKVESGWVPSGAGQPPAVE